MVLSSSKDEICLPMTLFSRLMTIVGVFAYVCCVEWRMSRHEARDLGMSLVLHGLLLGWMLHAPSPGFLAPSSVAAGELGGSLTHLYWPDRRLEGRTEREELALPQDRAATRRLAWKQSHKLNKPPEPVLRFAPGSGDSGAVRQNNRQARLLPPVPVRQRDRGCGFW